MRPSVFGCQHRVEHRSTIRASFTPVRASELSVCVVTAFSSSLLAARRVSPVRVPVAERPSVSAFPAPVSDVRRRPKQRQTARLRVVAGPLAASTRLSGLDSGSPAHQLSVQWQGRPSVLQCGTVQVTPGGACTARPQCPADQLIHGPATARSVSRAGDRPPVGLYHSPRPSALDPHDPRLPANADSPHRPGGQPPPRRRALKKMAARSRADSR